MKNIILSLSLLFSFGLQQTVRAQNTRVIGHRGAAFSAPENTLAAVKKGLALGADIIEIDIHLSADQKIMVIHDKDTKRTSNANLIVKETHSSELRKLDAGSWKNASFSGEKIPFLEEVLVLIPEDKHLFIEIKSGVETVVALQKVLEKFPDKKNYSFISFDLDVLIACKKQMPQIEAHYVFFSASKSSTKKKIIEAKTAGLEGVNMYHKAVSQVIVKLCKEEGLLVYCWTVNSEKGVQKLKALGVDGITSDRPEIVSE